MAARHQRINMMSLALGPVRLPRVGFEVLHATETCDRRHTSGAVLAQTGRTDETAAKPADGPSSSRYLTSVSILNIGRYIEITITPTMQPTPIIMIGSTIEVSDAIEVSTSSS